MSAIHSSALNCLIACALVASQSQNTQPTPSVDLTQRRSPKTKVAKSIQRPLPKRCKNGQFSAGDGFKITEDKERRPIAIRVIQVSTATPSLGTELVVKVRLENTGVHSIEIPWSADPDVLAISQTSKHVAWEWGHFSVILSGPGDKSFWLKDLGGLLYGSRFVPGSFLELEPNESAEAQLRVAVQDEYEPYKQELIGQHELIVSWNQEAAEQEIDGCSVDTNNISFSGYYDEKRVGINVKVLPANALIPSTNKKGSTKFF